MACAMLIAHVSLVLHSAMDRHAVRVVNKKVTAGLLNGILNALVVCPARESGRALAELTGVGLDDAVISPRRSPALSSAVNRPADVGCKPATVEVSPPAAEGIPAVILGRRLARFQVAGPVLGCPISNSPNRPVYAMRSWAFTEVDSGEHLCKRRGGCGVAHADQGESRDGEVFGKHLFLSVLSLDVWIRDGLSPGLSLVPS